MPKSKKIEAWRAELTTQLIALEDIIEENIPPKWIERARRGRARVSAALHWTLNFLKKLPRFLWIAISYAITRMAKRMWRGLTSPFAKFKPVERKHFQAIVELSDGQIIKSGKQVAVTYYFIFERIMPLIFTAEELAFKPPSRNQFFEALLDLLQIRNQPV